MMAGRLLYSRVSRDAEVAVETAAPWPVKWESPTARCKNQERIDKIVCIVVTFSMLLFIGFCAIILVIGIAGAFGRSESEEPEGSNDGSIHPEPIGDQRQS